MRPMLADAEIQALEKAAREHLLVSVTYNRGQSLLAPYTTYSSRGERYLRAITVARDGREPASLKLGTFKLSGLSNLVLTEVGFSPSGLFRQVSPTASGSRTGTR